MATHRIKLKVGVHEFEAEGDHDAVMEQLKIWKDLIASHVGEPTPQRNDASVAASAKHLREDIRASEMAKVFIHSEDGSEVSLRYRPTTDNEDQDAVLALIFGYRELAGKPEVLVTKLKTSLERSGIPAQRVDRLTEPLLKRRLLLKRGRGKGGIYQLTNAGLLEAEEVIRGMFSQIP